MAQAASLEAPPILDRIRDRVFRFAASRMSRENADDMTQEVMVVLAEKYGHISEPNELFRISIGVLVRKRIGYYRKRQRRGEDAMPSIDDIVVRDESDTPEQALGRKMIAERVAAAIRELGERCRKIVKLSMTGCTAAEIRTALSLPSENAANVAVSRCRKELRASLQDLEHAV